MIFMLLFFLGEEPESDTHGDNYQMDVRRLEQAFNISPTTEKRLVNGAIVSISVKTHVPAEPLLFTSVGFLRF